MASERVTVPNIGDAHDVDVIEVLVQVGAHVEREQALVVLESDKASMEIPSPFAGTVTEVAVKVGDKVSEGSALLTIDVVAAGVGIPVAEVTREVSAPSGIEDTLTLPKPPPTVRAPSMDRPVRTVPPAAPVTVSRAPQPERPLPHASPAVRQYARELGVDLSQVPGTAAHGRITKDDVQRFVKHAMSVPASSGSPIALPDTPEIDFSQFGETTLVPLTKIQKVSGRNLHRSWITIPHVTQFDEADITELEAFRKKMRAEHPDLKLTLLAFFMKGLSVALKAMPRFNSSLDKSGENLIMKEYIHIGVAVDTDNGLMVPVIRDVDLKGLSDLAKELEAVSERARARRLGPADLQGASMTISSLGGIGGTAFTPIINPPEVAVLGISRATLRPVYRDGAWVPRLMCPLSLSYDHRVIDGADAARFTTRLCAVFGDIRQMLL
jgi:pyruvate dehydrogenase E2 component (dihydrolipoamide acetyltransferase)